MTSAIFGGQTADEAFLAYITKFMRPGSGTAGDLSRGRRFLAAGGSARQTTVNIGTLNVNAPRATDATGIARDMSGAISRNGLVQQANNGLN